MSENYHIIQIFGFFFSISTFNEVDYHLQNINDIHVNVILKS